jgi:GNAT superfamily N-acetyltransferase
MSAIQIKQADPNDTETISSILQEAAAWLEELGIPLWNADQLNGESIQGEVASGLYWIAYVGGEPAGCIRYQLEDPLFWPDAILGEAAYLHKFAVRRAHAGGRVSTALIDWAKSHARARGHDFLRLDCETGRPALIALYERHGFVSAGECDFGTHCVVLNEFDLNAE